MLLWSLFFFLLSPAVSTVVEVSVDGSSELPAVTSQQNNRSEPQDHNKSDERIRRFLKSETIQYQEFVPCLDELPQHLHPYLKDYRKTTRDPHYSSLSCLPPETTRENRCFRAFYDGYEHLLLEGGKGRDGLEYISDRVVEIIYQKGLMSRDVTPIVSSKKEYRMRHGASNSNRNSLEDPFEALHVDYFEVSDYVMTAILYDEASENLAGGETCIADSLAPSKDNNELNYTLQEGIVVEPKKGRLVMFTGGGENLHSPLPIYRTDQERPTYIMFFKCKDDNSDNRHQNTITQAEL